MCCCDQPRDARGRFKRLDRYARDRLGRFRRRGPPVTAAGAARLMAEYDRQLTAILADDEAESPLACFARRSA